MTPEEALQKYQRIWKRVQPFNTVEYWGREKRRSLWQRAHNAWLDYLKAVKDSTKKPRVKRRKKKAPEDCSSGA